MSVSIYVIDIDVAGDRLEEAERRLDLLGADRCLSGRRRLARIALRLAIRRSHGLGLARLRFIVTPNGKPELPGTGLHFSLSHSGILALVGLSSMPLGVDIEQVRAPSIAPQRRAAILAAGLRLAPEPLSGDDDDARLVCAWTRLEAAAKAAGLGVLPLLARLGGGSIAAPDIARLKIDAPGDIRLDGTPYAVASLPVGPGPYLAAVCLPRSLGVPVPATHDAVLRDVLD